MEKTESMNIDTIINKASSLLENINDPNELNNCTEQNLEHRLLILRDTISDVMTFQKTSKKPISDEVQKSLMLLLFGAIRKIETHRGHVKIHLIAERVWAEEYKIKNYNTNNDDKYYKLLNNPISDTRFKWGDIIKYNTDPKLITKFVEPCKKDLHTFFIEKNKDSIKNILVSLAKCSESYDDNYCIHCEENIHMDICDIMVDKKEFTITLQCYGCENYYSISTKDVIQILNQD